MDGVITIDEFYEVLCTYPDNIMVGVDCNFYCLMCIYKNGKWIIESSRNSSDAINAQLIEFTTLGKTRARQLKSQLRPFVIKNPTLLVSVLGHAINLFPKYSGQPYNLINITIACKINLIEYTLDNMKEKFKETIEQISGLGIIAPECIHLILQETFPLSKGMHIYIIDDNLFSKESLLCKYPNLRTLGNRYLDIFIRKEIDSCLYFISTSEKINSI